MKRRRARTHAAARQPVSRRDQQGGDTEMRQGWPREGIPFGGARMLPRRRRRHRASPPAQPDQLGNRSWTFFQRILAALRSSCPPALPVVVRIGRIAAGLHGCCYRDRQMFVVRISNQLDEATAVDVLVHEWAHAIAWNLEHDRLVNCSRISRDQFSIATHGPDWGVAFSQAYVTYVKENACIQRERRQASRARK
jgi:hypothetical protein